MDALGINIPGLVAQIVNFVLLLLLLTAFGYKPIMRMLDERSKRIKDSLERAEQLKHESDEAQVRINARLDEARREGQTIINNAHQTAERLKEEARESARREADKIIERARVEIESERDAAIRELRSQFADLTVLAAERVIKRSLDPAAHRELIEQTLAEATARN